MTEEDGKAEQVEGLLSTPNLADALESEQFRLFLDQVPIAIIVAETKARERIVYANPEFEKLSRQTAAELKASHGAFSGARVWMGRNAISAQPWRKAAIALVLSVSNFRGMNRPLLTSIPMSLWMMRERLLSGLPRWLMSGGTRLLTGRNLRTEFARRTCCLMRFNTA